MSVVIVGGNECMTRNYTDLCKKYNFKAKVYPKMKAAVKDIGNPDLLVLFTGTMSHKMLHSVQNGIKGRDIKIAKCRSSSVSALKTVLDEYGGIFNSP